jgi:ribosomal protein S27AE
MKLSKVSEIKKAISDELLHWAELDKKSKKRNTELAKNTFCPKCGDIDWHPFVEGGYYCMKCGYEERK